jgi:murein L,D-transpeptidase YafK
MKVIVKTVTVALAFFLVLGTAHSDQTADLVLVIKSESRLYLINDGTIFGSFHVAFGSNPKGHKQQQGDQRTPEGHYILDYKNMAKRINTVFSQRSFKGSTGRTDVLP